MVGRRYAMVMGCQGWQNAAPAPALNTASRANIEAVHGTVTTTTTTTVAIPKKVQRVMTEKSKHTILLSFRVACFIPFSRPWIY